MTRRMKLNLLILGLLFVGIVSSHEVEASDICASIQVSHMQAHMQDSQSEFTTCNHQPAVFSGPTTDILQNHVFVSGFSVASWNTGQIVVGALGTAFFHTEVVDATHLNYFLDIVQDGLSLPSNLTAKVYARDGLGKEIVPPITISPIPALSGSFPQRSRVQIFAPTGPAHGSSSLDPSVLRSFVAQNEIQALTDFDARLQELRTAYPSVILIRLSFRSHEG